MDTQVIGSGRRSGPRRGWMVSALLLLACGREVTVSRPATDAEAPPSSEVGPDAAKTNLLDGIDQAKTDAAVVTPPPDAESAVSDKDGSMATKDAEVVTKDSAGVPTDTTASSKDAGFVAPDSSAVNNADATTASDTTRPKTDTAPSTDAVPPVTADAFTPAIPDASPTKDTAAPPVVITGLEVLVDGLSAIMLPAVGSDRVSLLQYTAAGTAMALHVTWNKEVGRWYESSGARHIYLAAYGTRHVGLMYLPTSYPIWENGGTTELSATPSSYKEYLAANETGFAWVDYPTGGGSTGGSGGGRGDAGGSSSGALGPVIFQSWQGAKTTLTDSLRYRSRIDLSKTHLVFVEYASTVAGTPGQIVVQPIAGGAATVVAPGSLHQDRPAVDGDWVVWEEYLNSTDAVIRAKNLSTQETRAVSSTVGFRTNPDIRGTRVVWEDQRSGNGDIYTNDLATTKGEQMAVTGEGHSTGARTTADGLVWLETNGNNIGLLHARWAM